MVGTPIANASIATRFVPPPRTDSGRARRRPSSGSRARRRAATVGTQQWPPADAVFHQPIRQRVALVLVVLIRLGQRPRVTSSRACRGVARGTPTVCVAFSIVRVVWRHELLQAHTNCAFAWGCLVLNRLNASDDDVLPLAPLELPATKDAEPITSMSDEG